MLRVAWFVTLLSLTGFGLCGPSVAQQWHEYRPAGAGYRVEFPGLPMTVTQTIPSAAGTGSIRYVAVARATGAFTSTYNAVPSAATRMDPQKALDGARDGAVRSGNGQVREERRLSIDGAPARRLVIDMPQKSVSVLLLVLSGNVLYQAAYVGNLGTELTPEVERFIGSFRLVGS